MIKNLDIGNNMLGLGVNYQLLARSIMRIRTINLARNELSTSQATVLLKTILSEKDLVMESLNMSENNLRHVDDQLLAKSVVRIKTVSLWGTCLLYTSTSPRDS